MQVAAAAAAAAAIAVPPPAPPAAAVAAATAAAAGRHKIAELVPAYVLLEPKHASNEITGELGEPGRNERAHDYKCIETKLTYKVTSQDAKKCVRQDCASQDGKCEKPLAN